MCQNRSMSGISKTVRITRISNVAAWFRTDCDDDPLTTNRQMSKCRLYLRGAMPRFFSVLEELCASFRVERRHLWVRRRLDEEDARAR